MWMKKKYEYMLIERGVELTRNGEWKYEKGSNDLILKGYEQVRGTMTYKRLCDAVQKRNAILKKKSTCAWDYEAGDIMIARFEVIR